MHYKYPCDICGKKFTRPQHVTRHKLLHTGETLQHCTSLQPLFDFPSQERSLTTVCGVTKLLQERTN